MTSSFHRIDLVEVLEQCHQQQQQPIVPPKRRQQNQQRYRSFDDDTFMDDDDVDDNVSTVSFMTTSGWDQTIMDQDVDALASWQQRQARGRFMTPHAVAVQTWVYGIQDRPFMEGDQDNNNNNNSIKDNNLQIRWKTSLAPHRIFQIASNENGTVIAATTDNGAITILRGRDGKVLATRRLTTSITMAIEGGKNNNSPLETTTTNSWCPHVSFIQSVVQNHTRTDALLVQLPSSHQPPILVSNIQGDRLNDENDAVVAQATQSMNLDTIQLPTISTKNVVLMEGYVHDNNINNNTRPRKENAIHSQDENDDSTAQTFRLVVIHEATTGNTEKCLGLAEYDLATRECRLVSKNVTVGPNGSGWEINDRIGLHIKPLSGHGKYVLALVAQCYNSPPKTYSKVLWLDPDNSLTQYCPSPSDQETVQAKLIGEYSLHQDPAVGDSDSRGIDNSTEMRVLSLNFVHSCDTDTATALAISIQQGNQSVTQILQAQILLQPSNPSPELYNLELGPVHLLYNIPIPASIQTMTACSVNAMTFGPYSFRAKVSSGWNVPEDMFVFQTASISNEKRGNCCDASSIGSIRLHTIMNKFEHARSLVHSAGMETLLQDKYANFHPAEIALQKLKHSLLESSPGDQGMSEALVALERGAGHLYGQRAFLDAADVLLRWPAQNLGSTCALSMPTFRDHIQGLSMFINTMKNVSDVFSDEDTPSSTRSSFQLKLSNLENKLCAVKYLGDEVCRSTSDESDTQQSKLPLQFAFVSSMDDLFVAFLKNEDFNQAEKMLRCYARSMLSLERIVDAFLQLPSEIHPRNYIYLLKDFVLPSLSINHELLPRILTWSSSKADDLDDESENGIDDAIELLETIEQATKKLRRKVHDSFAYHSPFVEQPSTMDSKNFLPSLNGKKSLGESSSGIFSIDESAMSDISMVTFEKEGGSLRNDPSSNICSNHTAYNTNTRPNPTILEIGRMKRGAQKTRGSSKVPIISRDDTIDENEESVEAKLEAARWLKEARSLGISPTLVTLRDFVFRGGATFLCNELIQFFSLQAMSHEQRYSNLHTKVLGFCKRARVPFDDALKHYAKRLCEGKSASPEAIEEAASVARCCQSPTTKCQITLTTLQSALFCRFSPAWLTKLSRDAIEWSAGDSSLRSELEEASRLLLIDEIVGRYCGNGAKELFHVDNPVHASRLLEFVCNNLKKESVLSDVLDLCEAFHHLSVEDGCGLLLQNTILGGNQEQASKILEELYRRNKGTAHQVYSRAVTFCIDLVDDYTAQLRDYCGLTQELDGSESDPLRHDLMAYTSCALTLTKVALSQSRFMLSGNAGSGFTSTHFNVEHLEDLSRKLERVKTLQSDFRIFLRISDLDLPEKSVEVVTRILSDIVDPYEIGERDVINKVASLARRVCSLLATDSLNETKLLFSAAINPARELALTSGGLKSLDLFSDLGISETSGCEVASRCCMSLSMTLCMRSTQKKDSLASDQLCSMKGVAMAASLLQDYALPKCEVDVLGSATSLSCLIDLISQVLFRADEGCGEQLDFFRKKLLANAATKESSVASYNSSSTNCVQYLEELANIRAPSFHPTWYVGDGLLLPPDEALVKGIEYCKQCMGLQLVDDPTMGIESFVVARGGHALGLRLLAHSMSTQICLSQVETPLELLMEFTDSLVISLVERYLGGTGTGITNGLVDSQLALSHLVSLPIKLAFKLYKSCLPTAISTRDFPRVVSLATIGKVSGTPKISFGMDINNAWSRQSKFVDQCETLATNAHWWCVLEEHHINFDPRLFEEDYRRRQIDHVITEKRFDSSYASTLIPDLIIATSQSAHSIYDSLGLIDRYASDFSLPSVVPISSYVQFLLDPVDGGGSKDDARCRVSDLEGTVRKLLHRVDETKQRLEILRSCLIHFEKDDDCTDYERLSVILSLYQAEMAMFIARDIGNDSVLADSYFMEMEMIDRRRDALAILSSYYEGEKKHQRPSFSDFFVPLSKKVGGSGNTEKPICCNVLGWESSTKLSEGFDPLRPLETTLRMSCSSSVASALSPLCLPLGVPKGYIRTRSLIAKFQKSKEEGAALPPYEEVDSVLKHLRSKSDIAELAEWCSKQYELENPFKLMCLNDALEAAIKASNEAERNCKKEPRSSMESEESLALARVKRISVAKDLLADRMSITTILQKAWDDSDKRSSFARTIQKLLSRLEEEVWKRIDVFVPEHFIDILFIEASDLACDATLCMRDSLSIGQLRKLSQLTHQICSCIAERYSHVQIGHLARRLTSRWLLYGDEHNAEATKEEKDAPIRIPSHAASDVDEEDTVDFQMDLSKLQDGSVWSSYTTGGTAKNINGKTVVALEEEPSSVKPSSLREISELSSSRCALRIAFVMAFADGYYSDCWSDDSRAIGGNEENSINSAIRSASKSKRRGLLSKVKASKSTEYNNQHEVVLAHCRELLRLVFAKSTFAGHLMKGLDLSIATESVSGKKSEASSTLTFAMRHRCLRVASILVPQDALEQVLKQDNYQTPANQISLKKCAFGAFCAKELEEMQLPIPHSDLGQLSHMHFPSYARALWRHHRDVKRAKGRLLLLIVELYLKEKISDYVFFSNLMKEIGGLRLPRTLLLAFESISRYMDEIGADCVTSFLESASPFLIPLLSSLSTRISSELKNSTVCESDGQEEKVCDVYRTSATSTSIRFSQVLIRFSTHASSQELLISHCTCMLDLLHGDSKLILEKDLLDMFYQLVLRVESINSRKKLMNRLEDIGVR